MTTSLEIKFPSLIPNDEISFNSCRVEAKTEQLKDREIQQMYAVDASTLYTPEAARKVYNPRKNVKSQE